MHLRYGAEQLENEPLLLHECELRYAMHFLIEVVTDKLPDPEKCLLLHVEYFIIDKYVRVFVKVEGVFDPVHVRFELPEPLIFNLREVQFAKHGALILQGRYEGVENLGVT